MNQLLVKSFLERIEYPPIADAIYKHREMQIGLQNLTVDQLFKNIHSIEKLLSVSQPDANRVLRTNVMLEIHIPLMRALGVTTLLNPDVVYGVRLRQLRNERGLVFTPSGGGQVECDYSEDGCDVRFTYYVPNGSDRPRTEYFALTDVILYVPDHTTFGEEFYK
jgi:hypothetical protein